MSRPTRVRPTHTEASKQYAWQVRFNYMRLFGSDPRVDLGPVRWDKLVREHRNFGILPMDAARGIHATETNPD